MFNLDDIDVNKLKEKAQIILKDKKKRQYFIFVILVILILILLVNSKNDNYKTEIVNNPENTSLNESFESNNSSEIYVDISGEVKIPGVYKVSSDTRLFEIIQLAGGLTDLADIDSLNQAEIVYDGQKIIVGTKYEENNILNNGQNTNGKISINSADSTLLQTLPGIGPSKAQKIIDYRNQNGRFKTIEDIKKVSGIGDATYESIKDLICL